MLAGRTNHPVFSGLFFPIEGEKRGGKSEDSCSSLRPYTGATQRS